MRFNYEWVADGQIMDFEYNTTLEGVLDAMGAEDSWTTDSPGAIKARAAQDEFVSRLKKMDAVGQVEELTESAADIVGDPQVVGLLTAMGIPTVGVTRVTVVSV